ncbi:MAG: chemotaxis protein CheC [Kangiellaceae bacterium]|nr:chemotaxis protein CheC [Kangiellaceae bacterium]
MKKLTEFQQDAIAELLNIGMGSAASSLSEMVGETVILSVPSVAFLPQDIAVGKIKEIVGDRITAVRESFKGSFWGDALLLFPANQSFDLVRALLKDDSLPLEMLSEMEQEALTEIGNIILNACLGSLANIFNQNLTYQLPVYSQGDCEEVMTGNSGNSKEGILLLKMEFSLQETNIRGALSLLLDVDSMEALTTEITNYFGDGS